MRQSARVSQGRCRQACHQDRARMLFPLNDAWQGRLNLEFKDGLPHPNSNHNPSMGTPNALKPYMSKASKAGIDNPYHCRD